MKRKHLLTLKLPFVGRERELALLHAMFARRQHMLISGSSGTGKSELLHQTSLRLPLLIFANTSNLDDACKDLERQLNVALQSPGNIQDRIIEHIKKRNQPIAFDNVDEPPTHLLRFIGKLTPHIPIWFVKRCDPTQGLGKLSEYLTEYVHLSVAPLKKNVVRTMITQAVSRGVVAPHALSNFEAVCRLCKGNPRMVERVLSQLSDHRFNDEYAFRIQLRLLEHRYVGAAA